MEIEQVGPDRRDKEGEHIDRQVFQRDLEGKGRR
jgi:hypothetical protein